MRLHADAELDFLELFGDEKKKQIIKALKGRIEVYSIDSAVISNGRDWFKFNLRPCLKCLD
jgi:hypothetical protein